MSLHAKHKHSKTLRSFPCHFHRTIYQMNALSAIFLAPKGSGIIGIRSERHNKLSDVIYLPILFLYLHLRTPFLTYLTGSINYQILDFCISGSKHNYKGRILNMTHILLLLRTSSASPQSYFCTKHYHHNKTTLYSIPDAVTFVNNDHKKYQISTYC